MEISRVTLIGAGAVGCVVAEPLSKYLGKENVEILASGERLSRYKKDGLFLNGNLLDFNYVEPDEAKKSGLLIIATKNLQLETALKMAENAVGKDTVILSLLNGIQSEEEIARKFGEEKTLYGFVLSLNSIHEKNQINCSNPGAVYFGEKDNSKSERVSALSQLFKNSGIKAINPADIHLEQWKKYLINVVFNTLSALTRSPYGGFRLEVLQNLVRKAGREVVKVAKAENVPLKTEMLEDDIRLMCSHDIKGKTSMLQDMEAGRKSENDFFTGTIIRLAQKHGIEVPTCTILYELVKATEEAREIVN